MFSDYENQDIYLPPALPDFSPSPEPSVTHYHPSKMVLASMNLHRTPSPGLVLDMGTDMSESESVGFSRESTHDSASLLDLVRAGQQEDPITAGII
jgi:hypothetical protein